MSAKNLDKHNRWRNKTVAFRVSPEEDAQIETAVKLTGLTKQDYIIRNVIKLRKRVLDAMYEESKTLFANIFVNLSKKVLTNQEKCAAVFANSENGPCN